MKDYKSFTTEVYQSVIDYNPSGAWTQIRGHYTPGTSGQQWIYLGDFIPNTTTHQPCTNCYNTSGTPASAYYYFDDVSVTPVLDITVATTPVINQYDCSGNLISVTPGTATVTVCGICGDNTYSWSNSEVTNPVTDLTSGTYTVVVSDGCGNSVSATASITTTNVYPTCRTAGKLLARDSISNESVKVYPNPSAGNITVIYQLSNAQGVLQLFDIVGKKVGEFILDGKKNEFDFDLTDLGCGIFEYRVSDGNAVIDEGRIVFTK